VQQVHEDEEGQEAREVLEVLLELVAVGNELRQRGQRRMDGLKSD